MWAREDLTNALVNGSVAVMPTDTLYGIVGSALNRETVERIYQIRKRNPEKPCIILISDVTELEKFSVHLSESEKTLLLGYWPGPVSIVVPCDSGDFEYLHRGTNTLAFRVPGVEELRLMLAQVGPLIAPSANTEGGIPSKNIAEAKEYFGDQVDLYIDGGDISGKASKVIKLNKDGVIEILRP